MYSPRAILDKEPVVIAGALRSLLYIAVLAGLLLIDEKLLAGIALGAELLLGLFVRRASTSTASPTLAGGTEVTLANSEETVKLPEAGG